jgi:hypothetical protein
MGDGLVCPPFRKSQHTLASHRAPAQVRAFGWSHRPVSFERLPKRGWGSCMPMVLRRCGVGKAVLADRNARGRRPYKPHMAGPEKVCVQTWTPPTSSRFPEIAAALTPAYRTPRV